MSPLSLMSCSPAHVKQQHHQQAQHRGQPLPGCHFSHAQAPIVIAQWLNRCLFVVGQHWVATMHACSNENRPTVMTPIPYLGGALLTPDTNLTFMQVKQVPSMTR